MADHISPNRRSENMRRIHSADTKPEMVVRRCAHALGYRYRLHRRDLPGCPDLVFPRHRAVVLVHGCFWHAHTCKRGGRIPKTNVEYWSKKIARNVERDSTSQAALEAAGWRTLVVWECEARDAEQVSLRLDQFLKGA